MAILLRNHDWKFVERDQTDGCRRKRIDSRIVAAPFKNRDFRTDVYRTGQPISEHHYLTTTRGWMLFGSFWCMARVGTNGGSKGG